MNLGERAVEAVRAHAVTARTPFIHEEVGDDIHLTIAIQDRDKYGVLVREISLRRSAGRALPSATLLAEQAAEIEKRFTYLLENFRLIELDQTGGRAQLRSGAPYIEAGTLHYYEIMLSGGNTLTFARYQRRGKTGEREIEPCYFTEQVLARICEDIVAIL
ncbi:MAG: hypothetical protein ACREOO_04125 [bacterium]